MPFDPGKMKIETNKESYKPGNTVKVTLKLDLKKPVKAKWLKVIVEGTEIEIKTTKETVQIKGSRGKPGKKVETSESEEIISALQYDEKTLGEDEIFESGEYKTSFKLPDDLQRTAKAGGAKVEYRIKAKLNIPLSFDVCDEKVLVIK